MSAADASLWRGFAPAIVACAGKSLTDAERVLFAKHKPVGFILFGRNIDNPAQVRALVASFRDTVGNPEAPVLIDQEGGRVARLKPPHWPVFPPAATFGAHWRRDPKGAEEAAYLNARRIGAVLADLGIDVDCAPVADMPVPGAHDVIGDRSFGDNQDAVIALGRATMRGLLDSGVLPVIKHLPGHGRAKSDSHLELPRVETSLAALEQSDFGPFVALASAPWAMTAHILFAAIDPDLPATVSPKVINDVIRRRIGFDNVLISDDLTMKALAGRLDKLAEASLAAGCDLVLHCSGKEDEMELLLPRLPAMGEVAAQRLARSAAMKRQPPQPFTAADQARLDGLLGAAAA